MHPALDDRRPEPARHLRPQAGPRQRRRVQGDRDRGAGHPDQRAPAPAGQADEGHRRHPLDEHEGGRSRPGDVQPADRLPADRPDPIPDPGLARGQGAGHGRGRAAELRQHRAGAGLQPGGVRPGVPRPAVRPAGRRRARRGRPGGPRRGRRVVPGRGPGPAAGRGQEAGGRPTRPAGRVPPGLPVEPPRDRPGQPPGRVPAGRPADAVGGGEGVRAGGRAGRAPRRLRPQPVRPGLPAGPPAGRAGRPVRRGLALVERRGHVLRLGHAPAELRGRQEAQRGPRPGLGDPDGRPAPPLAARLDPDRLDGRVRPDAAGSTPRRAATTSPPPGPPSWPAAASRAARSSATAAPTGCRSRTAPWPSPTSWRRSARPWGSTRWGRTTPTIGRPIRIVDPKARSIREVLA